MAEIRLEKKAPVWPWLIGTAVLALIVWVAFAAMNDRDDDAIATATPGVQSPGAVPPDAATGTSGRMVPAAVRDYAEFVRNGDSAAAGRAHEYTSEGLRKLAAALSAVAPANADSVSSQLRQEADRIDNEPGSLKHANTVRQGFTASADAIARYDGGAADRLKEIARSLEANKPLLDQKDTIQRYFQESASALERMGEQAR